MINQSSKRKQGLLKWIQGRRRGKIWMQKRLGATMFRACVIVNCRINDNDGRRTQFNAQQHGE